MLRPSRRLCPPHSQLAPRLLPGPPQELPHLRCCDETTYHDYARSLTTHPTERSKIRHHVQGYEGPGYAAHAHDDDAPDSAGVYEGEPTAVYEGDIAPAQSDTGTVY